MYLFRLTLSFEVKSQFICLFWVVW